MYPAELVLSYETNFLTADEEMNKPGRAIRCVLRRFLLNANGPTDIRTEGRTSPHKEMRGRI